jgi:hypothetical protein
MTTLRVTLKHPFALSIASSLALTACTFEHADVSQDEHAASVSQGLPPSRSGCGVCHATTGPGAVVVGDDGDLYCYNGVGIHPCGHNSTWCNDYAMVWC